MVPPDHGHGPGKTGSEREAYRNLHDAGVEGVADDAEVRCAPGGTRALEVRGVEQVERLEAESAWRSPIMNRFTRLASTVK
jgi:hypothetical protein